MEQSPKKSISRLSAQTGLSTGTCHKALKKVLHMHPYKISSVQQLHALDYDRRVQYCHWFNERLNDNNLLDLTFYSDEAWVHLSGYVNSQNYRTWAAENPHIFVETSLHPQKVGVWVAMSRRRIIGPIFFYETINGERYRAILHQAIEENLQDDELQHGFFQQDGATAHTANETLRYLQEFYGDRIISTGLWPPSSPDLTPLDYFLFGRIKNNIFKNRLHTLEELERAIRQEINDVTQDELERVFENMKRRVNLCLEVNGGHFEHLL
ncbi:uncharacterized protein LOC116158782 [Photinus pyralis]|uniref:uncharacterized protein LOC116158782 n=1 Tax=Photinus pyralis TaxID=7054 RepID=UPI0012673A8B|nr:uncharacterized protein LOC116158782 [Photinus pyralis]